MPNSTYYQKPIYIMFMQNVLGMACQEDFLIVLQNYWIQTWKELTLIVMEDYWPIKKIVLWSRYNLVK